MKKGVCLLLTAILLFCLCGCRTTEPQKETDVLYSVRFMTNCEAETVELTGGYAAKGENILFDKVSVKSGEKVAAPATSPVRGGYEFNGWYKDKNGASAWNFAADVVTSDVTLFADWKRGGGQSAEEYKEPELAFFEVVDDSVDGVEIYGVCNAFTENGTVGLTTAAIRILRAQADDVKERLNYRINSDSEITSAVFDGGKITVTYKQRNESKKIEISVTDVTNTLTADSVYEVKAVRYEANYSLKPYSVVLGGSSSMENWTTSAEDMQPITTINVGIGGTRVEHWRNGYAQRLIYPYQPRAVVLYLGINNIISAKDTGDAVGNALNDLFDDIHRHLPEATVYFVLINLVPGFLQYKEHIDRANELVIGYAADKPWLQLIDAGTLLLKETGKPNPSYFLTDGLHMSLCGYELWGGAVKKTLTEHEKELYQ